MISRFIQPMAVAVLALASAVLGGFHPAAHAEDTDIFTVNPALASARPNVLIILDNTANWETPFEAEKRALVDTVNQLSEQFNVGLMMFTETGDGIGSVPDGTYVRAGVRQMTEVNKRALSRMVESLHKIDDRGNNATYGLAMAEAHRYFGGRVAVSGSPQLKRDYPNNRVASSPTSHEVWALPGNAFVSASSSTYVSPIADDCAKNFIIFISNGPARDNNNSTPAATRALQDAGGNTAEITLNPNGSQSNIADEWARYLANADVNQNVSLVQNVYTYTVDVNPGTTGQGPAHTALLKSMATQGKGKYFAVTSNSSDIADALNKIFTEILSVNSVFASSALPASVNTRGTFLNQVYMGVFRPDGQASPRWPGNLKQYRLQANIAGQLELVDRDGQKVENPSTGLISETAKSFWSAASTFWDANYYPDVQTVGGVSDLVDGNLVEKGGVAYKLRTAHATDVTTRKVYTCVGCDTGTTVLSSQPFSTANTLLTSLPDSNFGIPGNASITSLVRTGSTATATTSAAHAYVAGQSVTIAGANQSEYNGTFTITGVPSETSFTYAVVESPTSPATGTIKAVKKAGTTFFISSMSRSSGNNAGGTDTATVNLSDSTASLGITAGSSVSITGANQSEYNGVFTVVSAGSTSFTVNVPVNPPASLTSLSNAAVLMNVPAKGKDPATTQSRTVTAISRSGQTLTVTVASALPSATGTVTLSGTTHYDGACTGFNEVNGSKQLSFTCTTGVSLTPSSSATGSLVGRVANPISVALSRTIGSSTVTATAASAHSLSTGDVVVISGANETAYNGEYSVTVPAGSTTTFTYSGITLSPASPATGTITASASGAISKNDLINWVRGENRRLEDNPSGNLTDVRAYLHGDVVHSRPLAINYNRSGQPFDRDIVVFYGANDGMLHAVKGGQDNADGSELWGFLPQEHFSKLGRLYNEAPVINNANSATSKPYFVDGPISSWTIDGNSDGAIDHNTASDQAYIYVGMRRGGRFLYALDVTNPESPRMLWKISNATPGFSELGQTWAEAKVAALQGIADKVLVLSAGYDPVANDATTQGTATMGRGVYLINARTGVPLWFAGQGSPAREGMVVQTVAGMEHAIAADATVIDSDGDGYADRIYLADTGGNIWRVNVGAITAEGTPAYADWTVDKLAALDGNGRKFLFPVDVVPFDDPVTQDAILVGSGDREQPFEVAAQNRFFMVKDSHEKFARPAATLSSANLCDLTSNAIQSGSSTEAAAATSCLASSSGWFIDLLPGEKVVTSAVTLNGATTFGTNRPESTLTGQNRTQCSAGLGESRLYTISFKDATAIFDRNADALLQTSDRYGVTYTGFPPSPVGVSVEIDGKYYQGVCTGAQCFSPPGPAIGRRSKVFWNFDNEAR